MGAVSFIESMDHSSLSHMTQEEFEKSVLTLAFAIDLVTDSVHQERR